MLATNIAETSLTIEGIRLVVDSGLERVARYDVRNGLTRLVTQRISQASMIQRAGRAGRLEPGICWHLFAKEQAERAAEHAEPEILQSDLASFWLELLQWGCVDVDQLTWLDRPPLAALAAARRLLHTLAAIDDGEKLTAIGRQMAGLGCEPRLAAMLCAGAKMGADGLATAAMLAALLEEPPRSGQMDIGYWLGRPQPHWQRRAAQLSKRLPQKVGRLMPIWPLLCWRRHLPIVSPNGAGRMGAICYQWPGRSDGSGRSALQGSLVDYSQPVARP